MDKHIKNIHDFDIDALSIILTDAKDVLDSLEKAGDTLDKKANSLLGILMILLVASVGYLASNFKQINFHDLLIQDSIYFAVFSGLIIYRIYKVLVPDVLMLKGTKPTFHIESTYFSKDWTKEQQKKYVVIDMITTAENSINKNELVHDKRAKDLGKAYQIIRYGMPAIVAYSIFYALIVNLLS